MGFPRSFRAYFHFMKQQDDNNVPSVCFFGIYDPSYPRNRVLARGFEENGYKVFHCRIDPKKHKGVFKFFLLVREYVSLRMNKFDVVIVAFPGHTVVWLARILFGPRIIFDAFVSLYNSNVEDRKRYRAFSLHGLWNQFLDWHSMKFASIILFDTNTQIRYVAKKFSIPLQKFRRVFVGTDDTIFNPREQKDSHGHFIVHFHGTFIPLHGIEYIIDTAKLLEDDPDIIFEIIGDGQERKGIEEKIAAVGGGKNIRLFPRMSYEELATSIVRADICLGIFGTTSKAAIVIPNKVFEALASQRALITMKSEAIKELALDGHNMLLCNPGDPRDIAHKIILLKQDMVLRNKIALHGYQLFTKELTPSILVKHLITTL